MCVLLSDSSFDICIFLYNASDILNYNQTEIERL